MVQSGLSLGVRVLRSGRHRLNEVYNMFPAGQAAKREEGMLSLEGRRPPGEESVPLYWLAVDTTHFGKNIRWPRSTTKDTEQRPASTELEQAKENCRQSARSHLAASLCTNPLEQLPARVARNVA
mmetsp:Transcript_1857/g.6624  ORF Transcript_1857/g.6624 Transcript_1857/m.6624 type:complete len:125 (-) Transcript_1857:184-558(-)